MTKRDRDRLIRARRRGAIRAAVLAAFLLAWCVQLLTGCRRSKPTPTSPPLPTPHMMTLEPEPTPEPVNAYPLTDEERGIVERLVTAEARGECMAGMMAVAWCVRNTAEATGMTPSQVIFEPGQYTDPAPVATEKAKAAVAAVFDAGAEVVSAPIRYFYAPGVCYSSWHENNLTYVTTIGGHRFFEEN